MGGTPWAQAIKCPARSGKSFSCLPAHDATALLNTVDTPTVWRDRELWDAVEDFVSTTLGFCWPASGASAGLCWAWGGGCHKSPTTAASTAALQAGSDAGPVASPDAQRFRDAAGADLEPGQAYMPPAMPLRPPPSPITPDQALTRWATGAYAIAVITCTQKTSRSIVVAPFVATDRTIQVVSPIFGQVPTAIEQPGGIVDGQAVVPSDTPQLEVGGSYFAFFCHGRPTDAIIEALPMSTVNTVSVLGQEIPLDTATAVVRAAKGQP